MSLLRGKADAMSIDWREAMKNPVRKGTGF
nr:MAG TPA: hypothetical protein [Caudoviricetes sp.]DAX05070.1 MAG TPA: hypothetical protein [Caudoviricetes sp.]